MLNPNMTRVWTYKNGGGFYELTPQSIAKGAAFLGDDCVLFSPIARMFAPTSYDRAIDLDAWLKTNRGAFLASETERAYCLAIQDQITCTFEPSGHEPFILPE